MAEPEKVQFILEAVDHVSEATDKARQNIMNLKQEASSIQLGVQPSGVSSDSAAGLARNSASKAIPGRGEGYDAGVNADYSALYGGYVAPPGGLGGGRQYKVVNHQGSAGTASGVFTQGFEDQVGSFFNGVSNYFDAARSTAKQNQAEQIQADNGFRSYQRDMSFSNRQDDKVARQQDDGFRRYQRDMAWMDRQDSRQDRTRNYDYDDPSAVAGSLGRSFLKGALYDVGNTASTYMSMRTHEIMEGRSNPTAASTAGYTFAGGLLGSVIGAPFGGYGGVIGAAVGGQVGNSVGQFLNAGTQAELLRQMSLQELGGISASLAGDAGGRFSGVGPGSYLGPEALRSPGVYGAERLSRTATLAAAGISEQFYSSDATGFRRNKNIYSPTAMSADELAQTFAGTAEAMVSAGIDPEQRTGYSGLLMTGIGMSTSPGYQGKYISGMPPMNFYGKFAEDKNLPLYQWVSENAAIKFGSAGKGIMSSSVDPIIASTTTTGGNVADILSKFGPKATSQFMEVTTPFGENTPVSLRDLMDVQKAVQSGDRGARIGALRATGAGAAITSALDGELSAITKLPGGVDSELYASKRSMRRQSMMEQYGEDDALSYGIPMTELQGRRGVANALPFAPGNIFSMDLETINRNAGQIDTITKRMAQLGKDGDLTTAAKAQMTSQIWSMRVQNAQAVGELSEGMENRLPAMSAGAPSFFSRYSSWDLAAANVGMMGSPMSGFGAINGHQRAAQLSFVQSWAGNVNTTAHSTTQALNTQPGGNSEIASALRDLSRAIQKLSGGGSGDSMGYRPGQRGNFNWDGQGQSRIPDYPRGN